MSLFGSSKYILAPEISKSGNLESGIISPPSSRLFTTEIAGTRRFLGSYLQQVGFKDNIGSKVHVEGVSTCAQMYIDIYEYVHICAYDAYDPRPF